MQSKFNPKRLLALSAPALLACLALLGATPRAAHAAGSGAPDINLGAAPLTTPPPATPPSDAPSGHAPSDEAPADDAPSEDAPGRTHSRHGRHHHQNNVVNIGHDSSLNAGEHADSVVAILGSASSAGDVGDTVFSLLGNTHVTGPVGDSAAAVLGNVYVDSSVNGDVVAVFGNVELGPHAVVGGDVASVGGTLKRDPNAIVRGDQQVISIGATVDDIAWLRPWIHECLLKARLLAFAPGLGWAWGLALVALGIYALCALLFPTALARSVQTLEAHPLQSVVAGLLTIIATPILFTLLCVSVIGILAVPFVAIALLTAKAFGKLVVLAWLGQRLTRSLSPATTVHPALSVLIGGAIMLLIYTLPVLSVIVYQLIGLIGLGVVVYSVLLALRARRPPRPATPGASIAGAPAAAAGAAAADPTATDAYTAASTPGGASPSASASASTSASASAPSALAALSYPRAGFWIRMGALLLDAILIGVILGVVVHSGRLHLLVLASYGAIMWKLRGATIGGIVLNLQVVRLDGRELDWSTAIVRALSCFLSLFIVGLGFIWIALDRERQAWHDKIAGTVVVRLPKGVSLV